MTVISNLVKSLLAVFWDVQLAQWLLQVLKMMVVRILRWSLKSSLPGIHILYDPVHLQVGRTCD